MTDQTKQKNHALPTIVSDDTCWYCNTALRADGTLLAEPDYLLIDDRHKVGFCPNDRCFIDWWNENELTEMGGFNKETNAYVLNTTAPKKEGDHPYGATEKEGYPPLESASKRRVTIPTDPHEKEGVTFTLADLRNMQWHQPLYKAVREILTERGNWKNKARGNMFKKGNPYRFGSEEVESAKRRDE